MKLVYDVFIYKSEHSDWNVLFDTLQHFPQFRFFDCSGSVEGAKKSLFDLQPDLVLFDASLLEVYKYEVLQHLLHEIHWPVQVAFITNSVSKAIGEEYAMLLNTLYLPLKEDILENFFWKIAQSQQQKSNFILHYLGIPGDMKANKKLLIPTVTGFKTIRLNDIFFFEYKNKERSWFLYGLDCLPVKLRRETNSDVLLEIAPNFIRINQKQIINPEMLVRIVNKKCILKEPYNQGDIELSISRDCQKNLKNHFVFI